MRLVKDGGRRTGDLKGRSRSGWTPKETPNEANMISCEDDGCESHTPSDVYPSNLRAQDMIVWTELPTRPSWARRGGRKSFIINQVITWIFIQKTIIRCVLLLQGPVCFRRKATTKSRTVKRTKKNEEKYSNLVILSLFCEVSEVSTSTRHHHPNWLGFPPPADFHRFWQS